LRIIIAVVLSGIIMGCSALTLVSEDENSVNEKTKQPVSKKISEPVKQPDEKIIVEQAEIPKVTTEKLKEKAITEEDEEESLVSPDKTVYSISDMNITGKANGVLIQLKYKGNDPKNNITTFFSGDNFFNITFYKGKFKPEVKKYIYNKAIVRTVKFIEFKESVQITVRLKEEYKSSFVSTDKNNITISLYN
jgi:hypothetical protein